MLKWHFLKHSLVFFVDIRYKYTRQTNTGGHMLTFSQCFMIAAIWLFMARGMILMSNPGTGIKKMIAGAIYIIIALALIFLFTNLSPATKQRGFLLRKAGAHFAPRLFLLLF